jgi:hypothetical protein
MTLKKMPLNIEKDITSHKNPFCNSIGCSFTPKNILYIVDLVNLKANEKKIVKKYIP